MMGVKPGGPWPVAALAAMMLLLMPSALPLAMAEERVDTLENIPGPSNTIFYSIAWKPDGSEALLVGSDAMVMTYSASSGQFNAVPASGLPRFLFHAAWRPDSLYALVVGADGAAFAYNGETLSPYCSTRADYFRCVAWRSDSSEALIVGSGGTMLRFRDGGFTPVNSTTSLDLYSCSWHPRDGTALITGANSTLLKLNADGTVGKIPFDGDHSLYSVAWDPAGGKALITGRPDVIATYDGANVDIITQSGFDSLLGSCWKPDGSMGLICGDVGLLWKYSGGRLFSITTGIESQLYDVSYRPQGDYALAVGYFKKVLRYPAQPRAEGGACLFGNPLVLAAVFAIFGGACLAYYAYSKRGSKPSRDHSREGRRSRLKRKRHK